MKIVFAGTPEFAAQAMRAIDQAGHEIVLVLTQPDRRAGRGMHFQVSPVKALAQEKNIPIATRDLKASPCRFTKKVCSARSLPVFI